MIDIFGPRLGSSNDVEKITQIVNEQLISLAIDLTASEKAKYTPKNYMRVVDEINDGDEDIRLKRSQAKILNRIAKKWRINKNDLL
jgi:hypothetical protein